MRTDIVRSLTTLVLTAICQTAVADEFPSRPVKIVVPYAAGGPSDTGARLVHENMSREPASRSSSRIAAAAAG